MLSAQHRLVTDPYMKRYNCQNWTEQSIDAVYALRQKMLQYGQTHIVEALVHPELIMLHCGPKEQRFRRAVLFSGLDCAA